MYMTKHAVESESVPVADASNSPATATDSRGDIAAEDKVNEAS